MHRRVLQRVVGLIDHHLVEQAREDRPDRGLTDFAAVPLAVTLEQLIKGADLVDLDDLEQLLPRILFYNHRSLIFLVYQQIKLPA